VGTLRIFPPTVRSERSGHCTVEIVSASNREWNRESRCVPGGGGKATHYEEATCGEEVEERERNALRGCNMRGRREDEREGDALRGGILE